MGESQTERVREQSRNHRPKPRCCHRRPGPDGTVREANGAVREILGYERTELLGTPLAALAHPEDRETPVDFHPEGSRVEKRYLHKQSHIVWLRVTFTPASLTDGSPIYVATLEDVSNANASRHCSPRANSGCA